MTTTAFPKIDLHLHLDGSLSIPFLKSLALEIGNPLQICEIVKNSRLLSFLPDFISQGYVQSGQLQTLDVADCQVKVWTQLLIHKNKWRSSALSAFISYYRNVMQE